MSFLRPGERAALEAALPGWLPQQRWFATKDRGIVAVRIEAAFALEASSDQASDAPFGLAFGQVAYEGGADLYGVPLSRSGAVPIGASGLFDGASDPAWWQGLVSMWASVRALHRLADASQGVALDAEPLRDAAQGLWVRGGVEEIDADYDVWSLESMSGAPSDVRLVGQDASNASALVRVPVERFNYRAEGASRKSPRRRVADAWVFVKVLRRLSLDSTRERDLLLALDPDFHPGLVPALFGHLEWDAASDHLGPRRILAALATAGYDHARDAWTVALDALRRRDHDGCTDLARRLGGHLAALHQALCMAGEIRLADGPARTRPLERCDVKQAASRSKEAMHRAAAGDTLCPGRSLSACSRALDAFLATPPADECVPEGAYLGLAIPLHGDLHLGQVLVRGDGSLRFVDFEGEPARSTAERLRADSPLRDVAGMLRSFDYVVCTALPEGERDAFRTAAEKAFLDAYLAKVDENRAWQASPNPEGYDRGTPLWPDDRAFGPLLKVYLLQKALYEVAYERAYRPDWAWIPEQALARLLAGP